MSTDLMHGTEIALVRAAYSNVPPTTAAVAHKLYTSVELQGVPETAIERALGVANNVRYAGIKPGEIVLDIGCGGGIDTVLAARHTGPAGTVFALDFLPEMLTRTTAAATAAGLENVTPVQGEMESIPCPDNSIDLIISNGVINLSPRKSRVFAECARVLRPGGRLCVADLTVGQDDLPAEILTQPAAWAGCVAGALAEKDFVAKLHRAGFQNVEVVSRHQLSVDDCALYPLFTTEVIAMMRRLIPEERQKAVAVAAVVRATLPT